jgi:uncharacterized protein (DUF2141 family)
MRTIALAALIVASAVPACAHAADAGPASLTLTFETGAQTGAVMVALFDSEAAYSGGAPLRQARIDVAGGERSAVFAGLPDGTYAARAFHDVNGNGRMDTNPFGQPTEPYAFSNNARGNMGPAGWDRAHFSIEGRTTQTIAIR